MKVFIGTMECGEGDFHNCIKSIKIQKDVEYVHFIISNLSEVDANKRLFDAWNQAKTNYELFLKIDADTVLFHNNVVKEFVDLFVKNSNLLGTQAWLYDYMTDSKIYGLSCIRNTVDFSYYTNPLYSNVSDINFLQGDDLPLSINPAGTHCKNATDRQAFYYGVHKALKNQQHIISKVYSAWKKNGDRARSLALIGARYSERFTNKLSINYFDQEFNKAFKEVEKTYTNLVKCL